MTNAEKKHLEEIESEVKKWHSELKVEIVGCETISMSKVIALVNQKGGGGKTTSTINIGAGLALKGKRVLLIDLDPQAIFKTPIRDAVDIAEAPTAGTDIFHYSKRSNGAKDYMNVVQEILERG